MGVGCVWGGEGIGGVPFLIPFFKNTIFIFIFVFIMLNFTII